MPPVSHQICYVCKFGRVKGVPAEEEIQTNVWKIRKIKWVSFIQPTFFKLGEYNPVPSILTLRFVNCVKFNFGKSCLPLDSNTNAVISDRFAYPVKMAAKTVIRPNASWRLTKCLSKASWLIPFMAAILLGSRAANSFVPLTVECMSVDVVNSLSASLRANAVGLVAPLA